MAMNNKEKQQLADLQQELARLRAWKLTVPVPCDVLPPKSWNDPLVRGYDAMVSSYGMHIGVRKVVTATCGHATVPMDQPWPDRTTSKKSMACHSTRSRALKAARYIFEQDVLKTLARVDELIEQAENEEAQGG